MKVEFNVFTDFKQFVVFDSAADWGDLYERWTDETIQSMFVQGDGYMAVGTMRAFDAPVVVRMEIEAPLIGSDRTAHGVLSVQSGILGVSGVTDGGLSGGTVSVPPGAYRVSVDYINVESVDVDGLTGDDRYVITHMEFDA